MRNQFGANHPQSYVQQMVNQYQRKIQTVEGGKRAQYQTATNNSPEVTNYEVNTQRISQGSARVDFIAKPLKALSVA